MEFTVHRTLMTVSSLFFNIEADAVKTPEK